MAALETSKLYIIPFINHQNRPLDWIFASMSTLCSGFSYTSIRDRDIIPFPKKNYFPYLKNQNHTIYLLCCSSFFHSTMRFPATTFHLAVPLPHNHPTSSNNTHIPNKRNWHKDFNAMKHRHISI
jgi:hypothetical protein